MAPDREAFTFAVVPGTNPDTQHYAKSVSLGFAQRLVPFGPPKRDPGNSLADSQPMLYVCFTVVGELPVWEEVAKEHGRDCLCP